MANQEPTTSPIQRLDDALAVIADAERGLQLVEADLDDRPAHQSAVAAARFALTRALDDAYRAHAELDRADDVAPA